MTRRRAVLLVVFLGSLCMAFFFLHSSCALSQEKAGEDVGSSSSVPASSPKAQDQGKESGQGSSLLSSVSDGAVPIQTEKIDEAGQVLGRKIDDVGRGFSKRLGNWVTAKAFMGITWLKLIVCCLLLLAVIVVDRVVALLVARRIVSKIPEDRDSGWFIMFLHALQRPISLFIRVYGFYWALSPLFGYFDPVGEQNVFHKLASKLADVGGTVAFFWFCYRFINVLDMQLRRWAESTDNTIDDMLVPLVGKSIRAILVIVGGMLVVQNMTGIELGPLIASLGIGGLAFALAGKDSIANFFGSLTILLDKPFQVGERIVIDHHDGFVENVGFRSTRLRTMTGHLVSIPNEKIINSTLENIGRRPYIRWHAVLTLTYDTPAGKVERAVEIVREILHDHEGMREEFPPRVFFNGFGDWSLNIAVYAWYHPGNFWDYQAWLQKTCLEIMRSFKAEGIELAFPTQTVYEVQVKPDGSPEERSDSPSRQQVGIRNPNHYSDS